MINTGYFLEFFFVLIRGHMGKFFKGLIKSSDGIETHFVCQGGIFYLRPPGTC